MTFDWGRKISLPACSRGSADALDVCFSTRYARPVPRLLVRMCSDRRGSQKEEKLKH